MDAHSNNSEDLNALERRLCAWEPATEGLDADAVLFAAGRASVRPSSARFLWPALTVLMTGLSVVFCLWLADERNERLALVGRLRERPSAPIVIPSPSPADNPAPEEPARSDELPPNSYLASRRALEKGLDAWPSRFVVHSGSMDTSIKNPPILRLGQRDALLEP
jgi:hypothetical protein